MKNKVFLLCLLFLHIIILNAIAQTSVTCDQLQSKLNSRIDSCTTIRIGCFSQSRERYFAYEKDRQANTHFIYDKGKGKDEILHSTIQVGEKHYIAHSDRVWKYQIASDTVHKVWLDSCIAMINSLKQPFQKCQFLHNTSITGTNYSVYIAQSAQDTTEIWFNRATNKIVTVVRDTKEIHFELLFDIPFEVVVPSIEKNEPSEFGFNAFPPAYITDESLDGTESVYSIADNRAYFKDGKDKMYQFLSDNIRYPKNVRKKGIEGKAIISFVIEKNGNSTNFRIKRSLYKECDDEAIRVLKLLTGKWEPAVFKGEKVRSVFTFPISFKLD
jgi:TonB family protein